MSGMDIYLAFFPSLIRKKRNKPKDPGPNFPVLACESFGGGCLGFGQVPSLDISLKQLKAFFFLCRLQL